MTPDYISSDRSVHQKLDYLFTLNKIMILSMLSLENIKINIDYCIIYSQLKDEVKINPNNTIWNRLLVPYVSVLPTLMCFQNTHFFQQKHIQTIKSLQGKLFCKKNSTHTSICLCRSMSQIANRPPNQAPFWHRYWQHTSLSGQQWLLCRRPSQACVPHTECTL